MLIMIKYNGYENMHQEGLLQFHVSLMKGSTS